MVFDALRILLGSLKRYCSALIMQAQTRQRLIAAEPSMAKKMGRRLVIDTASSIGADSRLDDQVSIAKSESGTGVIIARNTTVTKSKLGQFVKVGIDSLLYRVNVGDYTYLGRNAWLADTTIGKYCSIAQNLSCGTGNHPLHIIRFSPMFYRNYGITFLMRKFLTGIQL